MNTEILFSKDVYYPLMIAAATYIGLWLLKNIGIVRLKKVSSFTDTYVDDLILDVLNVTRQYFMIGVSLYVGFLSLHMDNKYASVANKIFVILIALQSITWGKEAVLSWVNFTIKKKNNEPSVATTMNFIGIIMKFVVIVAVLLFALNNLGVNVSTFIAGLGVGGIAIALATQNILGDLFSSLSIVLDKPFVVGDFINFGDWSGTVEHVGLKTTRVRSLSGEQIVVSNSNLLSARIKNYKRMEERRVAFKLGLTYSTKRENLRKAPALIEEIVKKYEHTRFDHAHFLNYGAFSLDIEVVYFVLSGEFSLYADIHQNILLDIHEAFEKNELEFAFPTQTLIMEKGQSVS